MHAFQGTEMRKHRRNEERLRRASCTLKGVTEADDCRGSANAVTRQGAGRYSMSFREVVFSLGYSLDIQPEPMGVWYSLSSKKAFSMGIGLNESKS